MTSRNGLPLERHEALGPELARLRDQVAVICAEVMKAWPRRTAAHDRAAGVLGAVDALRKELDTRFSTELGDGYTPEAYYPPPGVRDAPGMPSAAARHAVAAKVGAACQAAREGAPAAARDAAAEALLSLGGMHVAIADGNADEADMAFKMSWS
jgi:hypothetical protein